MLGSSKVASFLGDPSFPQVIIHADQGQMILLYQDFYKKYSRLGLTNPSDRPVAIDGLQERIISALGVRGGFGVFDEGSQLVQGKRDRGLLRRSLLWRRGVDTPRLTRVQFLSSHTASKVPSWSWMAYSGGIDYINPPFGLMDWNEIESPWSVGGRHGGGGVLTDTRGGNISLMATAQAYKQDFSLRIHSDECEIVLDSPGASDQASFKCVVLGKKKGRASLEDKVHYVLIIKEIAERHRDGSRVYERVGVGSLPGRCIDPAESRVHIQ